MCCRSIWEGEVSQKCVLGLSSGGGGDGEND